MRIQNSGVQESSMPIAEPIILVEYDPRWPETFESLSKSLLGCLGDLAARIEHVGSTAIAGMVAKPIIDIDVLAAEDADVQAIIRQLARIGYVHEGDLGIRQREAFRASRTLPRHHLYVCHGDGEEYKRHILFRDYLRGNSQTADAYACMKTSAAERFFNDRIAYTNAKSEFVEQVIGLARAKGQFTHGSESIVKPARID